LAYVKNVKRLLGLCGTSNRQYCTANHRVRYRVKSWQHISCQANGIYGYKCTKH